MRLARTELTNRETESRISFAAARVSIVIEPADGPTLTVDVLHAFGGSLVFEAGDAVLMGANDLTGFHSPLGVYKMRRETVLRLSGDARLTLEAPTQKAQTEDPTTKLREALEQFGTHQPGCSRLYGESYCTCGLAAALRVDGAGALLPPDGERP